MQIEDDDESDKEDDDDDAVDDDEEDEDDDDDADDTFENKRFQVIPRLPDGDQLTRIPCGMCRIMEKCAPGGLVSPESCAYMEAWLDF